MLSDGNANVVEVGEDKRSIVNRAEEKQGKGVAREADEQKR